MSYEKKKKAPQGSGKSKKSGAEDVDMDDADELDNDDEREYPSIVRAVSGSKKLSIVVSRHSSELLERFQHADRASLVFCVAKVQPTDAERFLNSLATVQRAHMDSLKKKERVRRPKKAKASKKEARV